MNKRKTVNSPILRVLFSQGVFNTATSIIASPVMPLYYRSTGASIAELGLISMLSYLGYAFFEPTLGTLSDRIGRKRIVVPALAADSLVIFLYTLFQDVRWFYLVAFLHAASAAGYTAPWRALVADITPRESRGRHYGAFLTVQSLGRVMGPYIGGYLAYNYGYLSAFYVSSSIMLASTAIVTMVYPKVEAPKEYASEAIKPNPRSILTTRTMIFIASRALPFFFMFYSTILTIVLKEDLRFNATTETLGLMTTTISIASLLAQYLSGLILDKIGSVNLIVIGFALDGVGYFGYLAAGNLAQMWLVRLIISAISPFYNTGMMVAMMELVSRENYGFAMGLYGLSEDIGGIIGSPVLGKVYDQYGFGTSTYFMVFLCFLSASVVWINMRRHRK
jgi:MFS family permease